MSWLAWAGIYAVGATGTFVFNRMIILGPIKYPGAVLRNVLLWPVMLPVLVFLFKNDL